MENHTRSPMQAHLVNLVRSNIPRARATYPSARFYNTKCSQVDAKVKLLFERAKRLKDNDLLFKLDDIAITLRAIDITIHDSHQSLLKNPRAVKTQKLLQIENHCNNTIDAIKRGIDNNSLDQYLSSPASLLFPERPTGVLESVPSEDIPDENNAPFDPGKELSELESILEKGEDNIDHGVKLFLYSEHFTDPKTGLLKNLTTQEAKHFSKWVTLFDKLFSQHIQFRPDEISPIYLLSINRILSIFDSKTCDTQNLKYLVKFLQSLDKPYFRKYHPTFADMLTTIFTNKLIHLNRIINDKSNKGETFKLEQGFKSKLVNAINKLLPDWPSFNNEQHLQLLGNIVTENDESYWFDLIYALVHHSSEHSHHLSSNPWQQRMLAQLGNHDPNARSMLAAIWNHDLPKALQVETNNHRLLWLKAFLHNQCGDHHSAYDAITRAEKQCDEFGLTTEPRLQLEMVRIKLDSLKATSIDDEQQANDIRQIIKKLDKFSNAKEGCTRFTASGLEQLIPLTSQELATVKLLKNEAYELKKASGRASPPQAHATKVQVTKEQATKDNDEPLAQEATAPALPSLKTPPPAQSPQAICKDILRHLQVKHHRNQAEALAPSDSFMVMSSNGKPISVTDAMKRDNWNGRILRLLQEVSTHRTEGDFINELLTYQNILTSNTDKQALGIHRLLLELSWTLMRHVDFAQQEYPQTKNDSADLLDYAWEFMMLSVCRAMRRSSTFPESLSDEQLVTTVIQWIEALQEPELKSEMEFFMRCALGSTAGHINGFRAELFPDKREHLEQRATHFFNAKHRLQPGYVKPQRNEDRHVLTDCMKQPQLLRWL